MSERPAKIVAMTDIDALIEAMTVEEKLAQLGCVWSTHLVDDHGFSPDAARRLLAHGTGQITRIALQFSDPVQSNTGGVPASPGSRQ